MKVKLLNLDGETLFLSSVTKQNAMILRNQLQKKIDHLQQGIYFVKYTTGGENEMERIVVY